MAVTLNATAVPAPVVPGTPNYMADQYATSGQPSTSLGQTSGNTAALVSSIMNRNATGHDQQAVYGGGAYAIGSGLTLSAGTGLACIVADGQAIVHGLVEKRAGTAGSTAVVGSSTTAWIWLKQDGTLTVQNGTTAKPTGNYCLLGAALTNASAVTAIETSGVVYLKSGVPYRETNDPAAPGDSPDSTLRLFTKTQSGTYFWNGTSHLPLSTAGAIVSRVTTQTVDNSTDTPVQFTVEDKDDATFFDAGANTKLTVPDTGWYMVSGGVDWDTNVNGGRYMHLKVNGTTFAASVSANAGVGDLRQHTTGIFYFTAGDYIEMVLFQTSGSQRTIDAARTAIVRVG